MAAAALLPTAADDTLSLYWPNFDSTKKALSALLACSFTICGHFCFASSSSECISSLVATVVSYTLTPPPLMHVFLDLFIINLIEYISLLSFYL